MEPSNTRTKSSDHVEIQDNQVNNPSNVLEDARTLWQEVRGLGHDRLKLVALEAQQASVSLVNMLMAGIVVASFLCIAWLGLLSALVITLAENGIMLKNALLLAVLANLFLALFGYRYLRRKSHFLKFPASLRSSRTLQPESEHS